MNRLAAWLTTVSVLFMALGLLSTSISQQTPVGAIEGRVVSKITGQPLRSATISLGARAGTPEADRPLLARTRADGTFRLSRVPAGSYQISGYSRSHMTEDRTVVVPEGVTVTVDLKAEPTGPYVELYTSQHVFTPSEKPTLQVRGYTPDPTLPIEIYRVDFDAVVRAGGLREILSPVSTDKPTNFAEQGAFTRISQLQFPIRDRDDEGTFDAIVPIPALSEGLYWVRVQSGGRQRGTYLLVTRLGLVTKNTRTESLAFVTDLVTGVPLPGVDLSVVVDGRVLTSVRSRQDGTANLSLQEVPGDRYAVVARQGDARALTTPFRQSGSTNDLRLAFWTDRPIYRPGDDVQFKVVARQPRDTRLQVPPPGPVNVTLTDDRGDVVVRTRVELSRSGSAHGTFRLPPERVGQYSVAIESQGTTTYASVEAAAYRPPDFRITVTPEPTTIVRGNPVRMRVKCEYYFGGPVVGAKLNATLFERPLWEGDLNDEEADAMSYGDWYGDYLTELSGVTNDQGEAVFTWTPPVATTDLQSAMDSVVTFQVAATENEGRFFEGRGQVRVYRGSRQLHTTLSTRFARPGEPVEAEVQLTDQSGQQPLANQPVDLQFGYDVTTGQRTRFAPSGKRTVTTDAQGRATVRLFPERQGDFVVRASVTDPEGRLIVSEENAFIWATAEATPTPASTLTVQLNQQRFELGQTARALIRTSKPGHVLVTLETDTLRRYWVVSTPRGAAEVSFPVDPACLGGAWVTAAQITEKRFLQAQNRVRVGRESKALRVSVTPDRTRVQPGESITYRITTTDPAGNPVSADVALAVVDESIYAIRPDTFDLASVLWPLRSPMVDTSYSFPELYLDGGDKAPANLRVRTRFRDTADWLPDLTTGADGTTTATVRLPDNVTEWRATAWAVDDEGRSGRAQAPVVARRDLVARITAPRYLVQGDEIEVQVMLNSGTDDPLEVNVDLTGSRVQVLGANRQRVTVSGGGSQAVRWTVQSPNFGAATLEAKAWANERITDGVRWEMTVQPRGREVVTSEARVIPLGSTANFPIDRRPNAPLGSVRLEIAPTLGSSLLTSLDELIDFPYGCTEQTMSRFMPAMVVQTTLNRLGVPTPSLAERIPAVRDQSLARLAMLQSYAGGWGWFQHDDPDPALTAYVLEGLARVRAAGGRVPEGLLNRGISWAAEQAAPAPKAQPDGFSDFTGYAYLGYAQSLFGRVGRLEPFLLTTNLTKLDAEGVAYIALASAQMAAPAPAPSRVKWNRRQTEATQNLLARLKREGDLAYWPSEAFSGQEPTARGFQVLVQTNQKPELQTAVLGYLLKTRRADGWTSTRDTALILAALTDYLAQTRELESSGTVTARLRDQVLAELSLNPARALEPPTVATLPWDQVREGDQRITVATSGNGRVYANVLVRQTVLADRFEPIAAFPGITLQRSFHRLTVERQTDGSQRLATGAAGTRFRNGEVVRQVLRIRAAQPADFLLLEIPTPANLQSAERQDPEFWNWWFSGLEVRDDRVVCFIRQLPKGESVIELNYRAETPGETTALPAALSAFYAPSARVSTSETRLQVNP